MGTLIFIAMIVIIAFIVYRYIDRNDNDHYPKYTHFDEFQE